MDVLIGRLHPLVVHLPIGFVLLAFLLESMIIVRGKWTTQRNFISLAYGCAFVASLIAVTSGLFLASHGTYFPNLLSTHRWLAITAMVAAFVVFCIKRFLPKLKSRWSYVTSVVLVILVSCTGHFGGLLTHGKDYLVEMAPSWVQDLVGYHDRNAFDLITMSSPDSVVIYADIIRPWLDRQCVECHNAGNKKGGFDASVYSSLFVEGEVGSPVVAGHRGSSEMVKRVTLPPAHPKFMPPQGHALAYTDILILSYWIEQGADSSARFDFASMSPELVDLLKRDYELDYTPRPHYEKVIVDSLSDATIADLSAAGFDVSYLGEYNYLLDIRYGKDTLVEESARALQSVRGNIACLRISDVILDSGVSLGLNLFDNLVRLDMHGSNIDDMVFKDFENLKYLEVLNLYNTPVSDTGLASALTAPSLKRVYVWKTNITDESLKKISQEHPDIQVIRGMTLVANAFPDSLASPAK